MLNSNYLDQLPAIATILPIALFLPVGTLVLLVLLASAPNLLHYTNATTNLWSTDKCLAKDPILVLTLLTVSGSLVKILPT